MYNKRLSYKNATLMKANSICSLLIIQYNKIIRQLQKTISNLNGVEWRL